jgi:hypothetical protein
MFYIDMALALQALEPMWATKIETASRLREGIGRILPFAAARGHRDGDSPAR